MIERHVTAYRRQWLIVFSGFFEPLFYLLSMRAGVTALSSAALPTFSASTPSYDRSAASVGIAMGMLITALHHVGLAVLTHTPSPMGFLNEILGRPAREKATLLLVVGFPAADARVPDIVRKPLDQVTSWR